jgi:hypothetical protein
MKTAIAFIHMWIQMCDIMSHLVWDENIKLQMKARVVIITISYLHDLYNKKVNSICQDEFFRQMCLQKSMEFMEDAPKIEPLLFREKFLSTLGAFQTKILQF